METLEYVTRARHVWWVVLVPLLAAAAAGAWQREQPPVWSATADVAPVVTGAGAQGTGGIAANEYASAFPAIATGTPLLNQVSEATDVPVDALRSDLRVQRSGDSTGLEVTFSSPDRDVVPEVLEEVTSRTLQRVFQTEVDQAGAAVERARQEVTAADTALTDFGTRTGVADPRQTYQALLNQLNNLDVRRVDATATGDTTLAAALTAEADRARASLAGYIPLLTEHDALRADRDTAQGRLDRALERLELAQEQLDAAAPPNVVFLGDTVEQDQRIAIGRTAATAGAVALVLCFLLLTLFASASRSRAARAARVAHREDTGAGASESPRDDRATGDATPRRSRSDASV